PRRQDRVANDWIYELPPPGHRARRRARSAHFPRTTWDLELGAPRLGMGQRFPLSEQGMLGPSHLRRRRLGRPVGSRKVGMRAGRWHLEHFRSEDGERYLGCGWILEGS